MFLKKIGLLLVGLYALSGCVQNLGQNWGSSYSDKEPEISPTQISANPLNEYGVEPVSEDNRIKTVSVLLPLSGPNSDIGQGIQHAIEIAFLEKKPKNILVSFNDLSGSTQDKTNLINTVVSNKPDLIIGPLFSEDAMLLKQIKPQDIPAITFTSAQQALGNGVFTLALLPNQPIESIVKQISAEGKHKLLIIAPETQTSYMLANNALESASTYNVDLSGMYFFKEGATDEMKNMAEKISLYDSRVDNLTKAKEILSDILMNEKLTDTEKESIQTQLDEMNKRDSLGEVPYDAVLFLGNAMDSKTMGAYLRYYDVSAKTTTFYGSAFWDVDSVYRDGSLAGSEYAGLPQIPNNFVDMYTNTEGTKPNRFNTVGYDAAMLAIKSLSGDKPVGSYLLDPSGYYGIDGLVRLRPDGENERALQIMQLNGVRTPVVRKFAEQNFVSPIYQTSGYDLSKPNRKKLTSDGYDPMDFLNLPSKLAGKYGTNKIGVIFDSEEEDQTGKTTVDPEHVEDVPEDTESVKDSDFKPAQIAPVEKKLIDEVKMKAN